MWPLNNGDIILVIVNYETLNVVKMMNTFYFRLLSGGPVSNGDSALDALNDVWGNPGIGTSWTSMWASVSVPDVAITTISYQKVFPTRIRQFSATINTVGLRTGTPLPQVACWTITKRSLDATRHGRGSLRIPGIGQDDETQGVLSIPFRPNAQTLADVVPQLQTTITPNAQWAPVIFNRVSPTLSIPIESALAQLTVRSQRTRIAFRGI